MNIAYLVNQYPKTSHSFIRREILAVEAAGVTVSRYSIRSISTEVVDEADQQEAAKTRYILGVGAKGLLLNLLRAAVTRPIRLLEAMRLTWKIGIRSERGLLLNVAYLAEACVLLQWLQESNITHLHTHFGTNSATVSMLCRVLGGPPYSVTVHGPEEFDKPGAIALSEKIQRAAFIVAVCSFGKSQLYRWCDYPQWSKIKVVHCGVDQMFLDAAYVPIATEPRFVCVGRLSEQKGHLMLIEAAGQLAAEGRSFKLVLVGDGPLRNQIEALIQQLNLHRHVEITGWATNAQVRQQILDAQVLVAPSFAEGLPVVIMEALALHRPVISTYIAGIPELVRSGKSGWLVPAGSVEELADAMRVVLQTPLDQLEQMGKTGAALVAQNHSAATEAAKLIDLFQS
ncbi:MAG: glycosyltransferase family 4 protein [Leptolyngbyaceae cyanobacterium bins.302]|nr:glycosyltransferase family 4 protein [Leptolyngbyaceae cyanobacterium bins.302]